MAQMRHNLGFGRNKAYLEFMRTVSNSLGFDLSDKAKFRLRCVELMESHGAEAVLTAFPQVSRASVYRWRRGYLESGKRLSSLIPRSTKPKKVRQMQVPIEILSLIKLLRIKYPRMSKNKIKPLLDIYCREKGLPMHSVSWIGKVINRYQFFFNIRKPVKRRRRRHEEVKRIGLCPKTQDIKIGYLQLDGVTVCYMNRTLRFITVVELVTRAAWVRRVPTFSSRHTHNLLKHICQTTPYSIHTVQTDNGSEFAGEFDLAVEELSLTHLRSYPKRPKTQGYVERFNWTLQDEFVNYHVDTILEGVALFDYKLEEWMKYYNHTRPHQGLNYQTPAQVLQYHQSQLKGDTQSLKCV